LGAKYEATYVVPGVTWTGVGKVTVCQPEPDSFVKVAWARRVPSVLQSEPMWVPVFAAAL
jgi:hypothetical protein